MASSINRDGGKTIPHELFLFDASGHLPWPDGRHISQFHIDKRGKLRDEKNFDVYGWNGAGRDRNGAKREDYDCDTNVDPRDLNFLSRADGKNGILDHFGFEATGINPVTNLSMDGKPAGSYTEIDENGIIRDKLGFDPWGWDEAGRDWQGLTKEDYIRAKEEGKDYTYNHWGYDADGYYGRYDYVWSRRKGEFIILKGRVGRDREGYDRDGFDSDGFDRNGFNQDGFDRDGIHYITGKKVDEHGRTKREAHINRLAKEDTKRAQRVNPVAETTLSYEDSVGYDNDDPCIEEDSDFSMDSSLYDDTSPDYADTHFEVYLDDEDDDELDFDQANWEEIESTLCNNVTDIINPHDNDEYRPMFLNTEESTSHYSIYSYPPSPAPTPSHFYKEDAIRPENDPINPYVPDDDIVDDLNASFEVLDVDDEGEFEPFISRGNIRTGFLAVSTALLGPNASTKNVKGLLSRMWRSHSEDRKEYVTSCQVRGYTQMRGGKKVRVKGYQRSCTPPTKR